MLAVIYFIESACANCITGVLLEYYYFIETKQTGVTEMNAGDKFTFEGKEYVFWKDSGETHFFAQECHANMKTRRIAYADLITATAEAEGTNVRFVAFMQYTTCNKTGAARNVRFMSWVAAAVSAYAKSKGEPHSPIAPFKINDQDDFSRFIVVNGRKFEW